jgi:hypothetical protein
VEKEQTKKIIMAISATCLLLLLAFSTIQQICIAAITSEQPSIVDARQMPFFNQMGTRLAEYNQKADWTKKIFPTDEPYLDSADQTVYVEVYVSDIDDIIQLSEDCKTGKTENVFKVYRATERTVKQLSEIPHKYFYVSKFSPSICMTVEKEALQQIANQPPVYCIRVIPPLKPFLSFSEIRNLDDIAYTMSNHDSTLDSATDIAIIDSGYDPNDSLLYGEANDNIIPNHQWDFTDGNTDVSNGANEHGSTVADYLVHGFGETGGGETGMYEDPDFWVPLKICDDSYSTANQYASQAIDWCIAHDMEIVCMSWGSEPALPWGINTCNGWWCDRFRTGTLAGITWVAAAGNGGHTNGVAYPAESHFVVAIGAYNNNPAQRESYSDYGTTYFATISPAQIYCLTCYNAQGFTEFKPNAYECGFVYWAWGQGTSIAAPFACADIAIGVYSPNNGEYTQGYEYLLDVIALSNEYPVSPSESSQQGDVIDTHTLWHRQRITP